jgi:hypothetical protein
MIALQSRNPQVADPTRITAQYANMMNMARQQEAAQLQGARTRQEMEFARAGEAREAELQPFKVTEAQSKANSERLKYVMDFYETSAIALSKSYNPQQAAALGDRMKQMFPEPELQQSIDETVAELNSDPANFEFNRDKLLKRTMEAKDQLAQEFTTQNLGTSTRVLRTPKYGRGAAEVVEGSSAAVDIKPTVVNVEGVGPVIVDPNTGMGYSVGAGQPGGYKPPRTGGTPTSGAPGKGGVAVALQTNPGALKDGAFAKSQQGYTGASGGFATFKTPEDGIRAQENLLRGSYVNKGFNTVNKIIDRYAPQGPENSAASVSNYKKYVAQKTGVDINAPITAAQIPAVAKAMREFETGNTSGRGTAGTATTPKLSVGEAAKLPGKKRVTNLVSDMIREYTKLNDAKAIPSTERGAGENIFDYISSGTVGKEVQKAFGTKASASLSNIESARKLLTTAIKSATNMSSKEMDSNTELQLTLNSLSDATQGYEAVVDILKRIDREYGLGTAGKAQGKGMPDITSFNRK